jgi:cysteine-rich repeat protein
MTATWTIKRGRIAAASVGVLSAWACTVADKGDYTFTDTPGTGGSSAGKGTGGSSNAGKGGTSGEAGVMETGGTGGLGARGGRGGRGSIGGRGGKAGQAGASGEAGEGGAAAVGGTGGTSGNAGEAGESGAGGEAGTTSVNTCGDGHVDSGEACDLGANNGVTACTYGKTSCTVCTKQCTRASGTATYCGDGKRQSSHEECDDGNTTTEGCATYDDSTCTACDSTCKRSVPRTCGDGTVNGDVVTSITLNYSGLWADTCDSKTLPFYLNGVPIPAVPQTACSCQTTPCMITITDPAVLAAISPTGNVLEILGAISGDIVYLGWATLAFNAGTDVLATFTFNPNNFALDGDLCSSHTPASGYLASAPFEVPHVEQCDGESGCTSCGYGAATLPGFSGERGPILPGWTQCAGYLDTAAGDEIPDTGWGAACKVASYDSLRVACGPDLQTYRYIDVNKNVLRDGTVSYPDMDLISGTGDQNGTPFTVSENVIYATVATPVDSESSWWGTASGCTESENGLFVSPANICSNWEVSDCFGQNLSGDRHLWVYIKP